MSDLKRKLLFSWRHSWGSKFCSWRPHLFLLSQKRARFISYSQLCAFAPNLSKKNLCIPLVFIFLSPSTREATICGMEETLKHSELTGRSGRGWQLSSSSILGAGPWDWGRGTCLLADCTFEGINCPVEEEVRWLHSVFLLPLQWIC